MSLSGSIALQIQGVLSSSRDLGSATVGETLASRITVTDGATANAATQVWGDTRTLALSTGEDLDLSGSLTNGIGESVALTRVIALMITADSANGDTISVGGAAANGFISWVGASTEAKSGSGYSANRSSIKASARRAAVSAAVPGLTSMDGKDR